MSSFHLYIKLIHLHTNPVDHFHSLWGCESWVRWEMRESWKNNFKISKSFTEFHFSEWKLHFKKKFKKFHLVVVTQIKKNVLCFVFTMSEVYKNSDLMGKFTLLSPHKFHDVCDRFSVSKIDLWMRKSERKCFFLNQILNLTGRTTTTMRGDESWWSTQKKEVRWYSRHITSDDDDQDWRENINFHSLRWIFIQSLNIFLDSWK